MQRHDLGRVRVAGSAGNGRARVDWTVLALISGGLAHGLLRLGERLHLAGGIRHLWHLVRTTVFWIVGLLNTVLDRIVLHRKERAAMSLPAASGQPHVWGV